MYAKMFRFPLIYCSIYTFQENLKLLNVQTHRHSYTHRLKKQCIYKLNKRNKLLQKKIAVMAWAYY